MNRKQLLKHWTVIEAFRNGKQVQYNAVGPSLKPVWQDTNEPIFDVRSEYRIKPEKKEIWVNVYPRDGRITRALGYSTREEAERFGKNTGTPQACVKVVYEEGEGL